jgi:hypothetical protein
VRDEEREPSAGQPRRLVAARESRYACSAGQCRADQGRAGTASTPHGCSHRVPIRAVVAMTGDKAIRCTTTLVAAPVSYRHALDVVGQHGASGWLDKVYPLTVDCELLMLIVRRCRHRRARRVSSAPTQFQDAPARLGTAW